VILLWIPAAVSLRLSFLRPDGLTPNGVEVLSIAAKSGKGLQWMSIPP
jgi:hypothetical protein